MNTLFFSQNVINKITYTYNWTISGISVSTDANYMVNKVRYLTISIETTNGNEVVYEGNIYALTRFNDSMYQITGSFTTEKNLTQLGVQITISSPGGLSFDGDSSWTSASAAVISNNITITNGFNLYMADTVTAGTNGQVFTLQYNETLATETISVDLVESTNTSTNLVSSATYTNIRAIPVRYTQLNGNKNLHLKDVLKITSTRWGTRYGVINSTAGPNNNFVLANLPTTNPLV